MVDDNYGRIKKDREVEGKEEVLITAEDQATATERFILSLFHQ